MPFLNTRTGQVVDVLPTGSRIVQRPTAIPQSSSSGSISPLSFVKQGLNLGGKFFGGTTGASLGALGSLAGLGLAASKGNPGGIVGSLGSLAGFSAPIAQGLGLGTIGSTLGSSLATGGSALANTLSGGLLGTAGPIVGAGAGASGAGLAGALGTIAGPLAGFGLLGTLPFLFRRGQPAKDIKAEGKVISAARANIAQGIASGTPVSLEDLRTTGSFTKDATGLDIGTNSFAPKLLAAYLNRGIDVPKIGGNYVFPIQASLGSFQAGQMRLRPSGEPLQTMLVSVPIENISKRIDKTTGEVTYRVPKDPFTASRDRRSEERSRSRDD